MFPQKSPFCPLFGPFYPHFASPSALRAAGASRYPAPKFPRVNEHPPAHRRSAWATRGLASHTKIAKDGRCGPDIHKFTTRSPESCERLEELVCSSTGCGHGSLRADRRRAGRALDGHFFLAGESLFASKQRHGSNAGHSSGVAQGQRSLNRCSGRDFQH